MRKLLRILERFNSCIPFLLVLFAGILTYKNILFSKGPAFQVHDIEVLTFPLYYFIRSAFIGGEFPLWNPYVMLGHSCLPNLAYGIFYPFLLGFLSMKFLGHLMPRHMELFLIGHLLFSGITMYWCSRKLGLNRIGSCLAGIVFQMAIINKDTIYASCYAYAMPWIPLALSFGTILLRSDKSAFCKDNILPFLITAISLSLIISIGYPNTVSFILLTFGFVAFYYIIFRIREKRWHDIFKIVKNMIYIIIFPILLNSIILLPYYNLLRNTVRYEAGKIATGMPLLVPSVWTLLSPGFANTAQAPLAYMGISTLLLALYFCIIAKKQNRNIFIDNFLFVLLVVFWFYYSVDGSLLQKALANVPILANVRHSQYGLIIYSFFISILAGKGLEILSTGRKDKVKLNVSWLCPIFFVAVLILTLPTFLQTVKDGYFVAKPTALYFGGFFLLFFLFYLIFIRFVELKKAGYILSCIIPVIVILEIFISSPPLVSKSNAGEFTPYTYKLEKFSSDFPECFLEKDLFRMDSFFEYTMAEYYFEKLSASGFYAGGVQTPRYYYLWNRHGEMGPDFEKWYVGKWAKKVMPISLDSKFYDLAGVKYLYLPENEWLFIDYSKSGQGEWVEAELFDAVLVYGIGIYNTPNPEHRRMLRVKLLLNEKEEIIIDVPNQEGWHKFYFKPIMLQKMKIIAEEVVPFDTYEKTRGVVIGEVELLDEQGSKIDVAIKNFNASSTMRVSRPSMIMDNRLGHVWESGCEIIASKTIPNKMLERVRPGCYINKNVLPRAFVVHEYKFVRDKTELLVELHGEDFEPDKVVLLEGEPVEYNIPQGPYVDNVEIANYKLNSVEILVKNNKPGFLILTDMYNFGWQVFVDGKKEELLISDGLFRGVFIDSGEHRVVFKYVLPFLKAGFIISLFTAIILVCAIIFSLKVEL